MAKASTYNKVGREDGILVVVGIPSDPEEGCPGEQLLICFDVVVDSVLGCKVRNQVFAVGQAVAVGQRAPDIMLKSLGLGCCVGQVDPLSNFNLHSLLWSVSTKGLEKVGDGKYGMRPLDSNQEQ